MEHGARSIIPPIIPVTGRVFIWRPAVVHPSSQEETLTSNYHKVSNRNQTLTALSLIPLVGSFALLPIAEDGRQGVDQRR
jgi:hypothetical protein